MREFGTASKFIPMPASRRRQCGYLMEIPLLLAAVLVVVVLLLPHLSLLGRKITLAIAAVPVIFCLYYMIVIPGWTPGPRLNWPQYVRWAVFIVVAGAIIAGVVSVILA